jgi:class 3 adenylate cyclase
MANLDKQSAQLERAIAGLEAQRALLGDAVVGPAIQALRRQLADIRKPAAPSLEGERKLVTVVFADISGFTALSEKLDPEQARTLMNDCFEQLVPVIEKYGGMVDKFVGDAIVALFGAPLAHENDPERALRAAVEMMEALSAFNAERGADLGLHFGINTGPVVAGGVGSSGRQEYSVMGHPVNLAARLEDASERGEIFVGPDTYRLTAPLFDFEPLPDVRIKGVSDPLAVYRLRGLKAAPGPMRGIQGLRSPLVGRDAELLRLDEALRSLREGRGGLVAVVAEAGVGKSRLIAEARKALVPGVGWFEGRALSHTQGMSYWMARDVLEALLRFDRGAPSSAVAPVLGLEVGRLFPEAFVEIYPYLARMLEVTLDPGLEERVRYLSAEVLQRRIVEAFTAYLRARAREEPLAVVWEDLHWADPSSLTLLDALLPLAGPVPLLLLLVYRPDEGPMEDFQKHAVAQGERYQRIELDTLSREESTRLLENLLDLENLSEEARALILDKAEGNAFFLEEVLRSLIDAGLVVLRANRAVATRAIQHVDVPDTLQGVVMARVDRLPAPHKRTLQTASVIGRVFDERLLARLAGGGRSGDGSNGNGLRDSLEELRHREFIRIRESSTDQLGAAAAREREYIFKHAITQEVSYSSLLLARRKELHRRAGEAIETLWPAQLDDNAATLGYHFQRAEVADKAIRYLSRAANRARAMYANTEAIGFYRAALGQAELLLGRAGGPQEPWRAEASRLQEALGDLLELTGSHDEARAAHLSALALVAAEDRLRRSRLHRKIAKTWESQRELTEALASYAEAERTLGERAPLSSAATQQADSAWWEEWIDIRLERMWVHYVRAELREMTEHIDEIRPVLERFGAAAQRSLFFLRLVLIAFRRDRYVVSEQTLDLARASLLEAQEAGDLIGISHPRLVLGMCHMCRLELDDAEENFLAGLASAERTGDVVVQTRLLTYLIVVQRRRGLRERVRHYIARTLEVATAGQMIEYVAMAKANLAWLAWLDGDTSEAETQAREALEFWKKSWSAYPFKWAALWPLIAVELAGGRLSEAVEHARMMVEPPQEPLPVALATAVQEALSEWDAQRPAAAAACFGRSLQLAREMAYL